MTNIAVQAARNKLMEACLDIPGGLKGCTEQEILSIEDHFHVQLPNSYRDFLSVMGRCAGMFLAGTDYLFPKMFRFRAAAEEFLQIYRPEFVLPPTAFVFLSHQGYNYCWFVCNKHADDPPVFLVNDAEKEVRNVSESFSAWLLSAVDDEIAAYRELNRG